MAGGALCRDRACEGDETRRLAEELGFGPVLPPHPDRVQPREYKPVTCRRRNEAERLFRGLKGDRRLCPRYDKPDVRFLAFGALGMQG